MKPESELTREEVLAIWEQGEPARIVEHRWELDWDVTWFPQHSSLCALNVAGHQGPCSCGAEGGGA